MLIDANESQALIDYQRSSLSPPLRCPFCGRRPSVRKGSRRKIDPPYAWQGKAGDWLWKPGIKCGPCKIDRDFESVEEALAWWNKRK